MRVRFLELIPLVLLALACSACDPKQEKPPAQPNPAPNPAVPDAKPADSAKHQGTVPSDPASASTKSESPSEATPAAESVAEMKPVVEPEKPADNPEQGSEEMVTDAPPEGQPEAEKPKVELTGPGADALRKMHEFAEKNKTSQVHVDVMVEMEISGETRQYPSVIEYAFEKPKSVSFLRKGTGTGVEFISDGLSLTIYRPTTNGYLVATVPDRQSELPRVEADGSPLAALQIAILAGDETFEEVAAALDQFEDLGVVDLNGKKAHHLRMGVMGREWELWIAEGDEPLPLKWSADLTSFAEISGGNKTTMTMNFVDWKVNQELPEGTFVFQPPKGAMVVEDLNPFSLFQRGGLADAEPERPVLLGQPAPNIQLPTLDQGEFNLEAQRDKKIVILDFWATWCGPCVAAMPAVEAVAKEFADKDVILVSVNQGEDEETIRSFLKEKGIDVNVALDADMAVGDAFGVQGIPTLVIIDKTGKIQVYHVGFSPNLQQELTEKLNDIVAGKDLAGEDLEAEMEPGAEVINGEEMILEIPIPPEFSPENLEKMPATEEAE
ncbi:redoxin family protein [Planctomicrobium sp. SH668]|uniref:redoxin family protein n=1 Tax=Planctomicrobium sp. SH668 TaxID=3448126 RepID=UPI003F5BC215